LTEKYAVRVVFLIEDSLPLRWVGPEFTPKLQALLEGGGAMHPRGGRAVLSTATYPNHARFLTGTEPRTHGILINDVWRDGAFISSAEVGPAAETLFAAARQAGVSTSAVLGDQKLVGVMGAEAADSHWPPQGVLPTGAAQDEFGYAADTEVVEQIDKTGALDAELAILHLNEPDSVCHLYGPDAEASRERFRATDAAFGAIVERLRPGWDDTVLLVVSDHDQEALLQGPPIDLNALLAERGLPGTASSEGTAAQVIDGPSLPTLLDLPGVEDGVALGDGCSLVWGGAGASFGSIDWGLKGGHGSPRTETQVALVAGGSPRVAELAAGLVSRRPSATDWAPTIAELLGFALSEAQGRSLLGRG
jgi:predicted AlkP superfamily pyrophosphatase or phosphodiesterase